MRSPIEQKGGPANHGPIYFCLDLKSFYASVECVDRGLDPLKVNLIVADPTRSKNTICLAITPAMKSYGIPNRCRVQDIPLGVPHIVAIPRMRRYMEVSRQIYRTYLEFVSPEDIYPYSIDEVFINARPYCSLYKRSAKQLAQLIIERVKDSTGITATAGIGPNLFLAKVALDIEAKHAADGIGELDEDSFRHKIWFHQPITDIWGIGHGVARRLKKQGIYDLAGICAEHTNVLYRLFGKNAEYLIDHAWGLEPATITDIQNYQPKKHSLVNGQALMRDYTKREARTILREMTYDSCMELIEKQLTCKLVSLHIGHLTDRITNSEEVTPSVQQKRSSLQHVRAQTALPNGTNSELVITTELLRLFDMRIPEGARIRRISLSLGSLSSFQHEDHTLFNNSTTLTGENALAQAMVAIRKKFGKDALLRGISLREESNARERNQQVGGHRA